jgi:hypothetical protein
MSAIFVKMPPGDAQRRGAERLADREAEEADAGVFTGNEQQDGEHEQQLDRDQHHADAHAGAQRDVAHRERLALQAGERRARVGQRVDADAVPRHAVAAAMPIRLKMITIAMRDGSRPVSQK